MKTKILKNLSLCLMLSFSIVTVGQGFTANAATQTSIAQSTRATTTSSIKCGNENINVTVSNDNANFKEVKVTDGNKVSIVKYDKTTNTAVVNGSTKIDFNQNNIMHTDSYVADSTTDLTGKYAYTVFNYAGGWWRIDDEGKEKFAQEKTVSPNTNEANTVPFMAFRASVNSLKGYEIAAAAAYGTASIALIAGLINTPETLGLSDIAGLVVAAGGMLAEIPICYNTYTSKKDCNFYFNRAYTYKTTGI